MTCWKWIAGSGGSKWWTTELSRKSATGTARGRQCFQWSQWKSLAPASVHIPVSTSWMFIHTMLRWKVKLSISGSFFVVLWEWIEDFHVFWQNYTVIPYKSFCYNQCEPNQLHLIVDAKPFDIQHGGFPHEEINVPAELLLSALNFSMGESQWGHQAFYDLVVLS